MWEIRCGTRPLGNPFESHEEATEMCLHLNNKLSHLYPPLREGFDGESTQRPADLFVVVEVE